MIKTNFLGNNILKKKYALYLHCLHNYSDSDLENIKAKIDKELESDSDSEKEIFCLYFLRK